MIKWKKTRSHIGRCWTDLMLGVTYVDHHPEFGCLLKQTSWCGLVGLTGYETAV